MTFAEEVSTYRFRLLGPRFRASRDGRYRLPRRNGRPATVLESPQLVLGANNAYLGALEAELKAPLRAVGSASGASALARGAVVNAAVRHMPVDQAFVSMGAGDAFMVPAGMVRNDRKTWVGIDDHRDRFVLRTAAPIGVLLHSDGHSHRHQLEGLRAAERFMADGCVLIVDGANRDGPRRAAFEFVRRSRRPWRIVLDERTAGEHPTLGNGVLAFVAGASSGAQVVLETETRLVEPVDIDRRGGAGDPPRVTVLHYRNPWVGIQDYPNLEIASLNHGVSLTEAFESSTGDYVVVLDGDVELTSDAVSEAVRAAESAAGGRRVLRTRLRGTYSPVAQAEYFPSPAPSFDEGERPQTVTVGRPLTVERDNLVSIDLDPELDDVEHELAVRFGRGWRLEGPAARCSRVPEGIVAGRVGAALTPDGRWLVESVGAPSRAWPDLTLDDHGRVGVRGPLRESGDEVATVVCERRREWWTANFGHWTFEVLTRVAMLLRARVPRQVKLLVPEPVLPFHRETIVALGIDEDRILPWDGTPTRFQTVYIATARPTPPFVFPAGIEVLRTLVEPARRVSPWRRLFISRRNLDRTTRIENEDELLAVAAEFGFLEFEPQTLPYAKQIGRFAEAKIIVGAHGSALANAVFMAHGTGVCELAPERLSPAKVPNFWDLAACGRQRYGLCVGRGRRVDPARFSRVLRDVVRSRSE